jgi:hypothetical protein
MAFLPPSTNDAYRGSPFSSWFLTLAALFTLGPALIHSFLPDGGARVIAGLDLGDRANLVIGVFRWEGATQLALGLGMLAVSLRYRTLTPLFVALFTLQSALDALQAWVLTPPTDAHHPPEHYGSVVAAALGVVFLALSLQRRARAPVML